MVYASIEKEFNSLKKENKFLKQEYIKIQEELRLLKKDLYGTKSESYEDPRQLIFNEIEVESKKIEKKELKIKVSFERKKGKQKRKPFPADLLREEKVIDLEESEKICPYDGEKLKLIGSVDTEKLKTAPAKTWIEVEKRLKYICPCCEKIKETKSDSLLPGTIVTPELLAFIVYSKFFQSLPLYRIEEQYKLQGIELKRGNMARWLIQISEKLQPIWNLLEEKVLSDDYLSIDASYVQVLREKNRRAQSKSFMWGRGSPEQGIILFDYDVSGGGRVAEKLLKDYRGTVQGDAHRGYGKLNKQNVVLIGCLMHARRRFFKAWVKDKKEQV